MSEFKLPRKKKKQYRKDFFSSKSKCKLIHILNKSLFILCYNKEQWENRYYPKRVSIRSMASIIKYPKIATNDELLHWYKVNYPNDKLAHHLCIQNKIQ